MIFEHPGLAKRIFHAHNRFDTRFPSQDKGNAVFTCHGFDGPPKFTFIMLNSFRFVPVCLCLVVSSAVLDTLAEEPFDTTFGKGLAELKARHFDASRALFAAAADSADIVHSPLNWLTAEFNACHALCLQGHNAEADTLAKDIAARCEAKLGDEDPLVSEALMHLAFVLRQHGHLADAEPVYRRNVQLLQAKYGEEHYLVAMAMTRHGSLLQSLGKLREAEEVQRKALAIMQKTGHENTPDLCLFLTNLAICLHAEQKTDEAAPMMQKAYDMAQVTPNSELTSAGAVLRRQAEYYRDTHQLERAEQLGHRALERLAKRPDINRARFFYLDTVAGVYHSILQAQGVAANEIDSRIRKLTDSPLTGTTAVSAQP